MLSAFYDMTSAVYWGSQPVTAIDEAAWMAAGLLTAVVIVTVSFRWMAAWTLAPAMVLGIFAALIVSFAPIKHAQKFIECEQSTQTAWIDDQPREVVVRKCRTRATLDGAWTEWQWQGAHIN